MPLWRAYVNAFMSHLLSHGSMAHWPFLPIGDDGVLVAIDLTTGPVVAHCDLRYDQAGPASVLKLCVPLAQAAGCCGRYWQQLAFEGLLRVCQAALAGEWPQATAR